MFELLPGYNEAPMTDLAMQLPMFSHGSAFTPDWNNDGVLDLWHHNHYAFSNAESRWSDPSTERKGPENFPGGCMVDWDAVLRNGTDGSYYPANDGEGFIGWADINIKERCFDVHSTSFIDIDGDGLKDLFLTTGGGRGEGESYTYNNLLFWGVATNSPLGYRLVGGRNTAAAAGLNGRVGKINDRGRHHYWLDVDGDGRLDVIFLNYERKDDEILPGLLYRNRNGRSFKKVKPNESGFAEFAQNMVLTDVDGDGMARELVVPSDCQNRTKPSDPPQNAICKRAPRGSMSIYRLSPENLLVRETIEPRPQGRDSIRSIASGDFDSDGLPDIVTLWKTDVLFHLSSARQKRCRTVSEEKKRRKCLLTLGSHNARLRLKTCGESGAVSIRFADFNLDGRLDMLAVCENPGLHSIYEQMQNGKWREMQTNRGKPMDFGALNALDLMLGGEDFCKDVPVDNRKKIPYDCLAHHTPKECKKVRYRHQWIICNLRHRFPHTPNATALGATVTDIDNDGFVDVIMGYRLGSMVMLRNTLAGPNTKYFTVRLDRSAGAPMAVGAIVKLTASHMGPHVNETTTQVRVLSSLSHETDSNGGHEDRLIFGLGRRGKPITLAVQWPHCCEETVIGGEKAKFWNWTNNMTKPYEVVPPAKCDRSCFASEELHDRSL